MLRCLELRDYLALRVHSDKLIAKRVGLDERRVRECLVLLEAAGQIRWANDKWTSKPNEHGVYFGAQLFALDTIEP